MDSLSLVPPPFFVPRHHHRRLLLSAHHCPATYNTRHHPHLSPRASATAVASSRDIEFDPSCPLYSKSPTGIYRHLQSLARNGNLHGALTALEVLEQRGVPVNATTFSHLLHACAASRSLSHTRALHAYLRTNSLHSNPFLLRKLALAYAAAGSPSMARHVLSRAYPPLSTLPWNALLRGHSLRGGPDTLEVFDEMRSLGVPPDDYTFSCVLTVLAASPSPLQAAMFHSLMLKSGFLGPSSLPLLTSLMDLYFHCRRTRNALKLLDEMPHRDVITWCAAIAGFSHNGMPAEALECARAMLSDSLQPNAVFLISTLSVVGTLRLLRTGRELHAFVLKHLPRQANNISLMSAIVDMYSKSGDLVSARRVFYSCPKRNAVLWTSLIAGYSSAGRPEQALRSVIWMQQEAIKPDVVTIGTILPVCGNLRSLKHGKELHAYALRRGFLSRVSITTSLITCYSRCGDVSHASRIFRGMGSKNVIAWTAMIDAYLANAHPRDAVDLFRSMQQSRQRPDAVAMERALGAVAELRALRLGREVHAQAVKGKHEWLPNVSGEIVRMYGMCGDMEMARRVFDLVASKGSYTWTSLIRAYAANGLYGTALEMFDRMVADGVVPNRVSFDVLMRVCKEGGLADEALRVCDLMVRRFNLRASAEHRDVIAQLLGAAGREEEAQRLTSLRGLAPA